MKQGFKLLQEAAQNSTKIIKANLATVSLYGLVIFLLSSLTSQIIAAQIPLQWLFSILVLIIYICFYYFLIKIALLLSAGEKVNFKTFDVKLNWLISYALASFFYMLMVTIGIIFLIIPGLFLATKYLFAPYILIDKKLSIKESFTRSSKLTEGKQMLLLAAILAFIVVPLVISILFDRFFYGVISNLLTTAYEVYTTFIGIYLYRKFEGLKS